MTMKKPFNGARDAAISAGARLANKAKSGEEQQVTANGLLAGAISFWLASHQPCRRKWCAVCTRINTPEKRLAELVRLLDEYARESPDYRAENDVEDAEEPAPVQ